MSQTFLGLIEGENRQTVKRHVFLDVLEHLFVNILDRHGLEELALVMVKHAELLLLNVVLCRYKALETHHEHCLSNVRERLRLGRRKRIRV